MNSPLLRTKASGGALESICKYLELPQTNFQVKELWLLDIDGVLTDPQAKRITLPRILDHIVAKLSAHQPVVLNSGRSIGAVEEKVIEPLRGKLGKNQDLLKDMLVVGEKGSTWMTFGSGGFKMIYQDPFRKIAPHIKEKIKKLVEEKYSASMFFDDSKTAMISVEMHDGYKLADFSKAQEVFLADVNLILAEEKLRYRPKVDATMISTDIEHPAVGKDLGTRQAFRWLRNRGWVPGKVHAIGDSQSDIRMADQAYRRGFDTTFAYVGPLPECELPKREYEIYCTESTFCRGTLEYLDLHAAAVN